MSEKKEAQKKTGTVQTLFEWVETFCLALLGVVVVFTFICRFVTVSGESMMNTLRDSDRLIISNLFYTPKTGDIVVVQDSRSEYEQLRHPIIKRVIATEGETVDIDDETWTVKVTHLDGSVEVLKEDYVRKVEGKMTWSSNIRYPHTVKEGCVFVMGDNRTNSLDSRIVGDIDKRKILGKAYVRIFPFTELELFL